MYFTDSAPTVYFDVDSTLVFTEQEAPELFPDSSLEDWVEIGGRRFWVHRPHVEHMRDFHARGHNVIVWSQGGALWAKEVVITLGLTSIVHACLSKPSWIFDDKPVDSWLCERQRSYLIP